MIVLVSNIGSTSFKFRLFDMNGEREQARGGAERIGSDNAAVKVGDRAWTGRLEAPFWVAAAAGGVGWVGEIALLLRPARRG